MLYWCLRISLPRSFILDKINHKLDCINPGDGLMEILSGRIFTADYYEFLFSFPHVSVANAVCVNGSCILLNYIVAGFCI